MKAFAQKKKRMGEKGKGCSVAEGAAYAICAHGYGDSSRLPF